MISKILAWLSGILAFAVMLLRGRLKDKEIESLQRDVEVAKTSEKAVEALVRGANEENKPIRRGYFNNKPK